MKHVIKLIKHYGIFRFLCMATDGGVYCVSKLARECFFRWTKPDFGLKEAFFWPKDIAVYLRYSRVLHEIKQFIKQSDRKPSILEVGAGRGGIFRFLRYANLQKKCHVHLADIDADSLAKIKGVKTTFLQPGPLPFDDNQFDIVISVDTLEHVPKDSRNLFLKELKRICQNTILMHFTATDPQNGFYGKTADERFQNWYIQYFNKPHSWTIEHLEIEQPTCKDIHDVLPNALITGTENIDSWFNYMTFRSRPLLGFWTGFLYLQNWKKHETSPPYHGCFVQWQRDNNGKKSTRICT